MPRAPFFHRLRLAISRWFTPRAARGDEGDVAPAPAVAQVPQAPEEIAEAAVAAGIVIPEACAPGVAANLALLASHAERMRGGGA
ncbi:hypothetical protein [Novosphingobium album (ex Hu et al. 2023)]|uniref:Uncharacterized protein n=1 Tax=Novosphingobium album (ex Hu et al. 2023) TaxID=2930093 RepID=A0ABT0B1X8_9SPHN|nr:hypothetical protein [Novosphingobium album (ex Hu et al. 2023)]MCJ2179037.1 hypothetical protein [Novosphingobium album (ex Hu et al. 2023)]